MEASNAVLKLLQEFGLLTQLSEIGIKEEDILETARRPCKLIDDSITQSSLEELRKRLF